MAPWIKPLESTSATWKAVASLLHEESMKNRLSHERRNEIEAEIRAITTALAHFLAAIETEQQIKNRLTSF
jgi:hypothetical protein